MKRLFFFLLLAFPAANALSQGGPDGSPGYGTHMITDRFSETGFPIISNGSGVAPIYFDPKDYWLVGQVARSLRDDIRRVTGSAPELLTQLPKHRHIPDLIIIGSLGQSAMIRQLDGS